MIIFEKNMLKLNSGFCFYNCVCMCVYVCVYVYTYICESTCVFIRKLKKRFGHLVLFQGLSIDIHRINCNSKHLNDSDVNNIRESLVFIDDRFWTFF